MPVLRCCGMGGVDTSLDHWMERPAAGQLVGVLQMKALPAVHEWNRSSQKTDTVVI